MLRPVFIFACEIRALRPKDILSPPCLNAVVSKELLISDDSTMLTVLRSNNVYLDTDEDSIRTILKHRLRWFGHATQMPFRRLSYRELSLHVMTELKTRRDSQFVTYLSVKENRIQLALSGHHDWGHRGHSN